MGQIRSVFTSEVPFFQHCSYFSGIIRHSTIGILVDCQRAKEKENESGVHCIKSVAMWDLLCMSNGVPLYGEYV